MTLRYKPRKYKTPVKAIREMCIECMGGRGTGQNYRKLIIECAALPCALYEFRFGKNPYLRPFSDKRRKELADRAKKSVLIQRGVGKSRLKNDDLGLP